ncbi:hypothetical protein RJ40_00890 [Methanofollis aquaemaris]|uniref:Uncharacterized protein n=1 Tax=Methanofollis aquaemaris TaxID=126734 RepID=A0A8A3S1I0_9EURY|nr:hypothetical protein [Methanofollis aquaemaris]QSZ66155.1 hypothetical protein RJ40_00890 [Methanofollis aquaemaris]
MRTKLQPLQGKRVRFTATFGEYGTYRKHGVTGKSILLHDLRDRSGKILADHIWINYPAGFDAVGTFQKGDLVEFTAKVDEYLHGYRGQKIEDRLARPPTIDYRLKYPRNVRKIGAIADFDYSLSGTCT